MPTWSVEDEKLLLLTIIDLLHINKLPAWADVANRMGKGYSNEACRQHFQKIRKGPNGPSTPRKTRVSKPQTPMGTPSKKQSPTKRKLEPEQDDDEVVIQPPDVDMRGDESPSKRFKAEEESSVSARKGSLKMEKNAAGDYVNLTEDADEEEEGLYDS